jgi:hypothetical protein
MASLYDKPRPYDKAKTYDGEEGVVVVEEVRGGGFDWRLLDQARAAAHLHRRRQDEDALLVMDLL